jgi:hypothetical protein
MICWHERLGRHPQRPRCSAHACHILLALCLASVDMMLVLSPVACQAPSCNQTLLHPGHPSVR